jgi:riboflavin biosynthesis pyrimidine reductase
MSKHKGRVSPRRRAAAVTVLSSIAADENAPAHSRVRAAAALVAAANREDGADDDPKGKRGRPTLIVLPDNGRDGERAEISRREDGAPVMVIATNKADLDRLEAEALAELDQMFPDDPAP